MSMQLIESLLYIIVVSAASLTAALLLYHGLKKTTDFVSGSSSWFVSDTAKITFRLSGAAAAFLVILIVWLYYVPYHEAVPFTEVWRLTGRIEAPEGVKNDDVRIIILPSPQVRQDMSFDIHLIREKDTASGSWKFPVVLVEPDTALPLFEAATIDPNNSDDPNLEVPAVPGKSLRANLTLHRQRP